MKKNRFMIAAFVATAALFLLSAFGATRAALITSGYYDSTFEMYDIGVMLKENGKELAWRTYDKNSGDWYVNEETSLFQSLTEVRYGQIYPETLSVRNSGQIDEYVRVTVYKYWLDKDGNKNTSMDPDLIHLSFLTGDNNWIEDSEYSTKERTVLYYTLPLKGTNSVRNGETTPDFMDEFMLDDDIKNYVLKETQTFDESTGCTTIIVDYVYDGCSFCVDVQVDAVQTHNAEDAAMSAWGRKITITDGVLSLGREG